MSAFSPPPKTELFEPSVPLCGKGALYDPHTYHMVVMMVL